jgi:tRNA (mo5U34)-methyltransferase
VVDRESRERLTDAEARGLVASHERWYHTIELRPGLVTPGTHDLRTIVEKMPWPDVRGKRCLDVGTADGLFAFELERRGATEVVAVDVQDQSLWDWPPDAMPGEGDLTAGFEIAARVLRSRVIRQPLSIYDLDPAVVGRFDVVVCGSIVPHLRDPIGALQAVRSVCSEWLVSAQHIDLWLSVLSPRRPLARLTGTGPWCEWWVPNGAAHVRMVHGAGFTVEQVSRPYLHELSPKLALRPTLRRIPGRVAERLLTRTRKPGVLTQAILARPRG